MGALIGVTIFAASFEIGFGENNWFADDNCDPTSQTNFAADRPSLECAEDAHRHNWGARFGDDQSHSRQRRLQSSVRGSSSFGKNERAIPCFDHTDQCFHGAAVDRFQIDGNDVELGQKPCT